MDKPRPCGCKGRRTCLICETEYKLAQNSNQLDKSNESYLYCPYCNLAWPGWEVDDYKSHPYHKGTSIPYEGIYIDLDFLTSDEHDRLARDLDGLPWDLSQSGRRKQNFGPKCNFKKRKLKLGDFKGFPAFTRFVQSKFKDVPILKGFQTIEQCSLEYDPVRGASIDPHIDDCWIWGERIVTVNLLADSVLTMTYNKKFNKYNLGCVADYDRVLDSSGKLSTSKQSYVIKQFREDLQYPIIRVPMPKRSLLVMYGSARYDWEHCVLREDIKERRMCLAYREFTPSYLEGGAQFSESRDILETAKKDIQ